jgi:DNA processing protein
LYINQEYFMKKLVLSEPFGSKLDRLTNKVRPLTYLGEDLGSYKDLLLVAIVGTRKPTPYGKMVTEKLAEELARAGVVVVSGLALGVDCLAHSAVLAAKGRTIAISPGGLQKIYPVTNKPVADKILANKGTIISEYASDHQPKKAEFLERNRIIAALSDLVIIPEAAAQSGSLNTASHALKMGIPVCVVPGNVTSPMSSGTNHLLKNGALAITETKDVLKLLGVDNNHKQLALDLTGDTPQETLVLQKIALGHVDASDLQEQTMLETTDFQMAVTMLEVQGKVMQDSLGKWRLS